MPKLVSAFQQKSFLLSLLKEVLFAKVEQVIAGIKFISSLTPDMVLKNDARCDIALS